jgi:hypothetical protein
MSSTVPTDATLFLLRGLRDLSYVAYCQACSELSQSVFAELGRAGRAWVAQHLRFYIGDGPSRPSHLWLFVKDYINDVKTANDAARHRLERLLRLRSSRRTSSSSRESRITSLVRRIRRGDRLVKELFAAEEGIWDVWMDSRDVEDPIPALTDDELEEDSDGTTVSWPDYEPASPDYDPPQVSFSGYPVPPSAPSPPRRVIDLTGEDDDDEKENFVPETPEPPVRRSARRRLFSPRTRASRRCYCCQEWGFCEFHGCCYHCAPESVRCLRNSACEFELCRE